MLKLTAKFSEGNDWYHILEYPVVNWSTSDPAHAADQSCLKPIPQLHYMRIAFYLLAGATNGRWSVLQSHWKSTCKMDHNSQSVAWLLYTYAKNLTRLSSLCPQKQQAFTPAWLCQWQIIFGETSCKACFASRRSCESQAGCDCKVSTYNGCSWNSSILVLGN